MSETVVVAKCVGCGHKKEVRAHEGQPMCPKCLMPMVAVKAVVKRGKRGKA